MQKVILILFVLISWGAVTFSGVTGTAKDTSVSLTLEKNKPGQTVNCSYNDSTLAFTLKIGNESVSGVFVDAFDIDLQALQIDKDDNYYLLVLKGLGPDDDNNCFFYEFVNGKIIPCGNIAYTNEIRTNGDKILEADSWMGFWTLRENYYFDSNSKSLVKKPKEFYNVNAEGKVTAKFRLLNERDDKSSSSGSLKPGEKITVVKADITPKCKDEEGNNNDWQCWWYYIKSSDGTEGWCRMRDFQQNVDGLPWAG